jgi:uncharacterized repeat protein (TIGR01451 family)
VDAVPIAAKKSNTDSPLFLRLTIQIIFFFAMLVSPVLGVLPAHAGCSSWRSPQKVWLNEYFFGVGANNPPNFLELYTTSPAFQTQWPGSKVEVYSAPNTKKTYTFTSTTATACTISGKTWITYNVLGGLESNQALVILRGSDGETIDAFVFDNKVPSSTTPWQNATNNWATGHTTGCAALDTALTNQAAAATLPSNQANMLILPNYGNKDLARTPDGGPIWDLTSNTGAGTTYTQCVSNNANLTKSVDNTTPTPDSTVTFTLSIANTGNSALTGITLDDYLPNYTYSGSVAPTYISAIPVNPLDSVTLTNDTTHYTNGDQIVDPNTNIDAKVTKITWTPAAIAAGTTAKLNIKMQLPNTAVPGYFYKNIAQTTSGLTSNQSDFADFTVGSQNVGSFVITVNPATASTCTPAHLGPQVTITAMTGPNGTGNVDPAYTGEDSSGNSVVYLTASSANLTWHDSSYTPITVSPAPENSFVDGVATFFLTGSTAETISVSALDTSSYTPNLMQGASGSITFTSGTGGVVLTDADTTLDRNSTPIYGVVAGRPHKVVATISQCGEPATTRTGTYSGTIKYTPGLNHPVGATPPAISTTASCSAPITLSSGTGTSLSLTFTSGVSNFYLCTADVGQFALNLDLNLTSPKASVSGGSSNFTVRPFVITASSFAVGADQNPKGSASTDTKFTSAGTPFSGTFDALKWLGAEDNNSDGIPDSSIVTPAILTAPRLPRFSGTTNNAGVITFAPKLNTPVGGVSGGFLSPSPSPAIASSGTVTLSTFTSSEVGSIAIGGVDPAGSYGATNYLGMSGLHVPILSDVIGRFVPHHFDTEVPSNACGTFSYSGQPFPARITARNISGGTTQNYTNTFAKDVTFSDTNGATGIFSPAPLLFSDFTSGIADMTLPPYKVKFTFTNKLTTPATIKLRAVDTDNVSSATGTEGTTSIRSGRLVLQNAYGPETAQITMPLRTEYYDTISLVTKFFTNTLDNNCTNVYLDPALNLDPDLQLKTGTGWVAGNSTMSIGSSGSTKATIAHTPFVNGEAALSFSAPGAGNIGFVDVQIINMPSWLQFDWDNNGSLDPSLNARVNFGIYRGNDRIINWREIIR